MGISRTGITLSITALAGVLVLSGCTADETAGDESSTVAVESSGVDPAGSPDPDASDDPQLSAFEQQLPLRGDFVSQQTETTGSVLIERRADGSTWATVTGFSTGDASDLRLQLKEGALEQDSSGAWVDTAGYSFDIGPLDPEQPDQEIAIPGAHTMPAIRTVSAMNYEGPDYPSFGSVSLER
ncbi:MULTISPECIES: hypothetical protein [unclassified Rathayibacter]|uniref:hypothetical protein n=1 Tax=unclassified Rathayibacter TaxID=2609250 RepID=UPI000F4C390B|nr:MULTISPECIES: hypothetical protein [unclassified Rathayibacter]ROP50196.1 hypothetical protein EDF45_1605 [Rathayibacter sp. PhB186]ROS53154.1 hypothetical protein EDF44_1605 [Rathayibacter sp. PhB185]